MRTRGGGDLGALLTGYVEELRVRRYSASSLEKARFELPRLIHHLGENGVRDARAVTEEHLVAYARHLEQRATRRGTPLAAASRASALSTVRRFFAFLASRGHILRDPAEEIPLPRSARLPRGILTESQARRLVAAPFPGSRIGKRDRAILEMLYGTGIRLGEAARADVSDLDLRERVLLVRSGKGKKDRVVPVPGRAAAAIDTYLAEARPELVEARGPGALHLPPRRPAEPRRLAGVVQRHGRAIGLDVSPHALRHTCATHLLRGGAEHSPRPGATRPPMPRDDRALYASRHRGPARGPRASAPAAVGRTRSPAVRSAVLSARQIAPESPSWVSFGVADPHKIPIDPNGNLTQKTEGSDSWTYTWNAENQLTKVEKDGAEVARFAYDPLGRRVEKVAGGVTTSYTYDESDVFREVRGTSTVKYVHGDDIDEPLAIDDGGTHFRTSMRMALGASLG